MPGNLSNEQIKTRLEQCFGQIQFSDEGQASFPEGEDAPSTDVQRQYVEAIRDIQTPEQAGQIRDLLREANHKRIISDQNQMSAILMFLQQNIQTAMRAEPPRTGLPRGERGPQPIKDFIKGKYGVDSIKKDPKTGDSYYTIKYGPGDSAEEKIFINEKDGILSTNSENPAVFKKMMDDLRAAGFTSIKVDPANEQARKAIEAVAKTYDPPMQIKYTTLKKGSAPKQEKKAGGAGPDMAEMLRQMQGSPGGRPR